MSEDLTLIETKSLNSALQGSASYQATTIGDTAQHGTPLTQVPVSMSLKDITSGIHPTLSYAETFSILILTLVVPLLTKPVTVSKEIDLYGSSFLQALCITAIYICAFLISGLFAEMHQYHGNNTGSLVWVARKHWGYALSYLALAGTIAAALPQVVLSLSDVYDLIERQSKYFFEFSLMGDWAFAEDVISLFLLLILFVLCLLGITLVSRISILFTFLSIVSVFTVSGFAIYNNVNKAGKDPGSVIKQYGLRNTSIAIQKIVNKTDVDNDLFDDSVQIYLNKFFRLISQTVGVTFLISLTEDNTLKKSTINVIGGMCLLLAYISAMVLNLSVASSVSVNCTFVDQISIKVGIPPAAVLTVAVIASIGVLTRGYFILYSVCRILLHVVTVREEGDVSPTCRLLKIPILVYGCQCLVMVALIFLPKDDLETISLVSLFIYVLLGGVCHILHRYSTEEQSESTPILGSFGSLKSARSIKILIIVLILSSIALASIRLARVNISFASYLNGQIYATFTIVVALVVIGTISFMASFQQQRVISMFYKVVLWTPIIPSAVIILSCVVVVFHWIWGFVAIGVVIFITMIQYVLDRLCTVKSEDPSSSATSELG